MEKEGQCQGRKEKQTEQMFVRLGGWLGGCQGNDGRGPAAVPGGRRATVSAGLGLAELRAELPGIKQEPHTVAACTHASIHTNSHKRTQTHTHKCTHTHTPHRARGLETNKQRELDKRTPSRSKVCIQDTDTHTFMHARTHTHTLLQKERAGLCARAEARGVWRVWGGINGL